MSLDKLWMDTFKAYFLHQDRRPWWETLRQFYIYISEQAPSDLRQPGTKGFGWKLSSSSTCVCWPCVCKSLSAKKILWPVMQVDRPVSSFLGFCLRPCSWIFLWPFGWSLLLWRGGDLKTLLIFTQNPFFPFTSEFIRLLECYVQENLVFPESCPVCQEQNKRDSFVFCVF